MTTIKILILATSHEQLGDTGRKTGLWLEELAIPYYIFLEAGALVTLASPKGGPIPLDPKSESIIVSNTTTKRFLKDPAALSLLFGSVSLDTLYAADYDIVLLLGGHGAVWDFSDNAPMKTLLEDFNRQEKLIGAIGHGVTGLLSLQTDAGRPLLAGRSVTGCSNAEERSSAMLAIVPFLTESALQSIGAVYSQAAVYSSHLVVDNNLITGQNPSSSQAVARKLLSAQKGMPVKAIDSIAF